MGHAADGDRLPPAPYTVEHDARGRVPALPDADRGKIAAGFVFTVAAMLSLATSAWRIDAPAGDATGAGHASRVDRWTDFLVSYATEGMRAALGIA